MIKKKLNDNLHRLFAACFSEDTVYADNDPTPSIFGSRLKRNSPQQESQTALPPLQALI